MLAKRQVFAMLLAWGFMALTVSADTVIIVKKDNAGVYQNRIRTLFETPVFTVSTQDRLLVLETSEDKYLVRDREGREGWIEKDRCVIASRRAKYSYDPVTLEAFPREIGTAVVIGNNDSPEDQIYLDRSFREELKYNTDKETVERQAVN